MRLGLLVRLFPLLLGAGCTTARVATPEPAPPLPIAKSKPPAPAPRCEVSAGPAPLRRLTRDQYINSVFDLLAGKDPSAATSLRGLRGVSTVASMTLPADETVGPFRSNVVAAPTELDAQQLMEASERAAEVAANQLARFYTCEAGSDPAACARRFVDSFGRRVFRRPLRAVESDRYTQLFLQEARSGGPADGLRSVVSTLLQSPYFLDHTREDGAAAAPGVVELGPYALASRLAYMLWLSAPDEALLDAAASGSLATPAGLRAQAERMLADERAQRAIVNFHLQWLGIEDVSSTPKNSKLFPFWSSDRKGGGLYPFREAIRRETEQFVDHVIRHGDGKLDTLLTAPFSFVDEALFGYYGITRPANYDPSRPVALDPKQRAGLLTQGSFLAFHAHTAQSSPVARGVMVRKNLLCQDLPDPPPDVNNNPPDPDPKLTTRERFEEHRLDGVCGGCHKLIDPIGFGFENYDAVGQYRERENGNPIDATGELIEAGDVGGAFDGAVQLANKLAKSKKVQTCYVKQWFRYALGRMETEADACSLKTAEDEFERSGRDVRALLLVLPTTDSFRMREVTR